MDNRQSTTEDVKRLQDQLRPQPGDLIPWAALEEMLAPLTRQDRRFSTIYRAWIRHLRRWENRKMVVVPGQGLRVLHELGRSGDVAHTLGRTWTLLARAKTEVDEMQIVDLTPAELAAQLGETEAEPRKLLRRLTRRLGPMVMTVLLEAVWKIEAQGGIVLPNGQRRTPGGVLFYLTKVGATLKPPPRDLSRRAPTQEEYGPEPATPE